MTQHHPTVTSARHFVQQVDLPTPRVGRDAVESTGSLVGEALAEGKQQAAVVGSEIVAFASNVTNPWRQDLINSTMLAQLVANKAVPDATQVLDWYGVYFDVLGQIGWAVHDRSFATYEESGQNFSAHAAILQVAAGLLAPAGGSLALVKTTLEALRSMSEDSPWITLFSRESRHASTARFQVSVAEQSAEGELSVALMAFGLEAKSVLTQVLFFKGLSSQARLRHCAGRMAVNTQVLEAIRPDLKAKLIAHSKDFLKTLPAL